MCCDFVYNTRRMSIAERRIKEKCKENSKEQPDVKDVNAVIKKTARERGNVLIKNS
jgi:hypothetical protein